MDQILLLRRLRTCGLWLVLWTLPWAIPLVVEAADSSGHEKKILPWEDMVRVPAGEFQMGSDSTDPMADSDERPSRRVLLDTFHIGRTEVTYRDYQWFLSQLEDLDHATCHDDEPRRKDHRTELPLEDLGDMDHPILGIDWYDAYAFCAWAGLRLPTEAEWEKAARGTDGRIYPWGTEWDPSRANAKGKQDGYARSAPVGSFPSGASPYGALDMAGNAWEWVADPYRRWPRRRQTARRPLAPEWSIFRVIRGGSWINHPENLRTAERSKRIRSAPTLRYLDVGFRCAADTPR